jgi:hypothetical protein
MNSELITTVRFLAIIGLPILGYGGYCIFTGTAVVGVRYIKEIRVIDRRARFIGISYALGGIMMVISGLLTLLTVGSASGVVLVLICAIGLGLIVTANIVGFLVEYLLD